MVMPVPPRPLLLDETLRTVARRYRLPPMTGADRQVQDASAATSLVMVVEQARLAVARGDTPGEALKRDFIKALARMIHDAMKAGSGDPAFQAMVLRHRAGRVREYASLSAHANQDRRAVIAAVNTMAHPAKQQRAHAGAQREALAQLHASASDVSASWAALFETAQRLLAVPETANHPTFQRDVTQLLGSPALARLRRLDALASDAAVRQYQALWDQHGPRSGSAGAAAQGSASRQRGAAVEALATQALQALAQRLNHADASASYRVVTSMRVPASIPASPDRAKSEWDAVLLRQAQMADAQAVWDVCLLVEAKASVDAATTDLPRLLRGMRLLAHAEENKVYPFETQQGVVHLRGESLSALPTGELGLKSVVLYCCNAPADAAPRLLGAASRMQLLSASASLEFASYLAQGQKADPQDLEPVWDQMLASPGWGAVLHQYPMLWQVRELMVHTEDLLVAINGAMPAGAA